MLKMNTEIVDGLDLSEYSAKNGRGRPSVYRWRERIEPLGVGQTFVLTCETPEEADRLIASLRGWLFQKDRNVTDRKFTTRKISATKYGVWRLS
tara:strand:+ start:460 stop:741 length:282 start_codon:yes stop_codon:yes gene_type:complete